MGYKFLDDRPIFEQIIDIIVVEIANGEYKKEQRISSVRDLAVKFGVNPNTVQKALTELERVGILYSKRGDGRFVGDVEKVKDLRLTTAMKRTLDFCVEMQKMGFDKEDISSLVKEVLNGNIKD